MYVARPLRLKGYTDAVLAKMVTQVVFELPRRGTRTAACFAMAINSRALLIIALVLGCSALYSPAQRTPQFIRSVWRVQDGVPENTVQSIQQTSNGFLWVGTTGGAVRFDGAHFVPVPAGEGSIFSMLAARDGTLWMGTEGAGLVHAKGAVTRVISSGQGLTDGFVRVILQDRQGRIWAGTDNGLFLVEHDHARRVDTPQRNAPLSVHALMQDSLGRIWVGGSKLLAFNASQWSHAPLGPPEMAQYTLPGAASENRVKSLLETADHTIWIGTVGGLDHLVQDRFKREPTIHGTVRTMLQTTDGLFWVGTIGHGLFLRRGGGPFTRIDSAGSNPINTVLALCEDQSQQLWVGSQDGLIRMRRTPLRVVPLPGDAAPDFATLSLDTDDALWMVSSRVYRIHEGMAEVVHLKGLNGIAVRNVVRDREGTLWIGTDGHGVYHQTEGGLVHYDAPGHLVNDFVRAFLETHDGTMWIGTDEGVSRIRGGQTQNLRVADGLAYFSIRCLLEDRTGDVWIGTERGLSHWHNDHFVQDGLTLAMAHEKIWSLLQAQDGALWIGTRDHGLFRHGPADLEHMTTAQGLASDSVYQMVEGPGQRMWLSGPNGLSSFSLLTRDPGPEGHLGVTVYDLPDGNSGTQMYGGRQPAGVVDANGAVWFPSTRGAVEATSPHPAPERLPGVEIEAVIADGQALNPAVNRFALKPSLVRLAISFTPVSIRPQGGIRFRYRLEGFDPGWVDAGSARTALYTSLPSGSYRFRVQVFDAGHPDHTSEAELGFRVDRHFYRTAWFFLLCLAICALFAWLAYALRLRQIRLRFRAVIEERNRLAREMHDTVIQGCTGVSALLEAMSSLDVTNQPLREDLLDHARSQVRSTINEARHAVWNLRHQGESCDDFLARLERLAAQIRADFGAVVHCREQGNPIPIPDATARELLMVAREAAQNAALHAAPTHVDICLQWQANSMSLEVTDDGAGFIPAPSARAAGLHYGIAGMRERVEQMKGDFTIRSEVGRGTVVRAVLQRIHKAPTDSRDVVAL